MLNVPIFIGMLNVIMLSVVMISAVIKYHYNAECYNDAELLRRVLL